MIAQILRDPWRAIWQIATSDGALVILLLGIAIGLTITSWLPQVPAADPVAYARWLSEAQIRFGRATPTLQTLGLFTITRSFGFRALLALLGGCLLLRLTENIDQLRQGREIARPLRWPWADLFPPLAHAGGLLLLLGLLITHLWGWHLEGLILKSGERITLPGGEKWVALSDDARNTSHSPGIVTFVEEHGPGVQVNAIDGAGRSLTLQTVRADPVTQLTVALTEDQYFAIPEAQLGVRLAPQPGRVVEAHTPVLVQVYRSPPGQLATEAVLEGETELTVDDVTLTLTSLPYARLSATFNPSLWPTSVGLALLAAGLLGNVVETVLHFRPREGEEA